MNLARPALAAAAIVLLLLLSPLRGAGQDAAYRVGIALGGTGLVGLVLERVDERTGLEVTLSTWSFRDVGVSGVAKAYLGPSAFRPVLGAGFWIAFARPSDADRAGVAVLARFPVGFDWRAAPGHFLGLEMNVNRALWIQRADVTDELPANPRLVPIPGVYYRWRP